MEDNQYEYQGIQFIGKLSSEIYRRGYIYFTKRLVPFDINYIQLLCLISLYIKDNQSQEQITDDLSIDKSSVHRAIKGLIDPQEKAIAFKVLNQMTQNANQIYEEEKKKNDK